MLETFWSKTDFCRALEAEGIKLLRGHRSTCAKAFGRERVFNGYKKALQKGGVYIMAPTEGAGTGSSKVENHATEVLSPVTTVSASLHNSTMLSTPSSYQSASLQKPSPGFAIPPLPSPTSDNFIDNPKIMSSFSLN